MNQSHPIALSWIHGTKIFHAKKRWNRFRKFSQNISIQNHRFIPWNFINLRTWCIQMNRVCITVCELKPLNTVSNNRICSLNGNNSQAARRFADISPLVWKIVSAATSQRHHQRTIDTVNNSRCTSTSSARDLFCIPFIGGLVRRRKSLLCAPAPMHSADSLIRSVALSPLR